MAMAKRFVAYGELYKAGKEIGRSGLNIPLGSLDGIIESSPGKVPVMKSYLGKDLGPDKVIGHAELKVEGDGIFAKIVFNERWRKVYESALQSGKLRKYNRLGFMMRHITVDADSKEVRNGTITYLTLMRDALGGEIDKFGWEEVG